MKKLYYILLPLHMLLMALVPAAMIACKVMDYTLILKHPMAVLIAVAVLSVALSAAIFFSAIGCHGNFLTGLLGHLDFGLTTVASICLMYLCQTRLAAGLGIGFLLIAIAIPAVSEGDHFPTLLDNILCTIPFVLAFLLAAGLWLVTGSGLPRTVYQDLPSPNGAYTAVLTTRLDDDEAYRLASIDVARTDAIVETELFRLFPNVMSLYETSWKENSVRGAEWISGNALLVDGREYPVSGGRLLPVSTTGL